MSGLSGAANPYRYRYSSSDDDSNKIKEAKEPFDADKRLQNWRRWMEIRKNYHDTVRQKLKRSPSQSVGNKAEMYRTKQQERLLIDYSKIPAPDKYRGCPGYWKYPCGMISMGPCPCQPPIFGPITKEQACKVPSLEIIGTANKIYEEKDFGYVSEGPVLLKENMWQKSKYKKHVESKIPKERQHYKPNFFDLCIIGTEIKPPHEDTPVDLHSKASYEESVEPEESVPDTDEVIVAIEFAETRLSNQITQPEIKKYYFYIDYIIPNDGIIQNKIKIHNIGNITVDFQWKRVLPTVSLDIIPKREPNFAFAFQKMRQILLLNETKYVTIYFSTNTPGFYEETWVLETVPIIPNIQFYLILRANAVFGSEEEIINNLKVRLDEGIKNKIVDDTMVDLLSRVHILKPDVDCVINKRIVTEKDIFESLNMNFKNNIKPIIYHYNRHIINSMKDLYKSIRLESDPEKWSLKLEDLEKVIAKIEDPTKRNNYKHELNYMVNQLLKTDLIRNTDKDKYAQVYYILCCTIDQITEQLDRINESYEIELVEKYPKITIDTLVDECMNVPHRKIKMFHKQTCKNMHEKNVLEKPCEEIEALKQTSIDDPETLYKVYQKEIHGAELKPSKTKDKDKKGKKDKSTKDNKSNKDGKNVKDNKSSKKNTPDILLPFDDLLPTYPEELDQDKSMDKPEDKFQDKPTDKSQHTDSPSPSTFNIDESKFGEGSITSTLKDFETMYTTMDTQMSEEIRKLDVVKHNRYLITHELLGNAVNDIELTILSYTGRGVRHHLLNKIFDQPLNYWETESYQFASSSLIDESESDTLFAKSSLSSILSSYSLETSIPWLPMADSPDETKAKESTEYVDRYTETSDGELFENRTQHQYVQTIYADDIDKEHLIERIEIETNASPMLIYED